MSGRPGVHRNLTQRYDMGVLNALSKLDQEVSAEIAKLTGVDPEDATVTIDVHGIYSTAKQDRSAKAVRNSIVFLNCKRRCLCKLCQYLVGF